MKKPYVWVIGDLMLDVEVRSERFRRTPEDAVAPVLPSVPGSNAVTYLGGAGNLAANLATLGCRVDLFSQFDPDKLPEDCAPSDFPSVDGLTLPWVPTKTAPLTVKRRYYEGDRLVARVDSDYQASPITVASLRETGYLQSGALPDAIVLTDYGRGTISKASAQGWAKFAEDEKIPIYADPKVGRSSVWDNCRLTCMVCNWDEATDVVRENLTRGATDEWDDVWDNDDPKSDVRAAKFVQNVQTAWGPCHSLVVKRGQYGSTWLKEGARGRPVVGHVPAIRRQEVINVQGAGDTYLAGLVTAMCRGAKLEEACVYGSAAAGVAVSHKGTYAVKREEVLDLIRAHYADRDERRVVPIGKAIETANRMRAFGFKIGYTNGCFDGRLHAGHRHTLREAKAHCDYLFVGVDSDARVRKLKGPDRPLVDEVERARSVDSLHFVDSVFVFNSDPADVVNAIKPDVLVKGGDYAPETVPEAEALKAWGGRLHIVPSVDAERTSAFVNRVRGLNG